MGTLVSAVTAWDMLKRSAGENPEGVNPQLTEPQLALAAPGLGSAVPERARTKLEAARTTLHLELESDPTDFAQTKPVVARKALLREFEMDLTELEVRGWLPVGANCAQEDRTRAVLRRLTRRGRRSRRG